MFRNERLRFYRGGRERHRPRLCNDTCLHRGDRPPSKLQGLEMPRKTWDILRTNPIMPLDAHAT